MQRMEARENVESMNQIWLVWERVKSKMTHLFGLGNWTDSYPSYYKGNAQREELCRGKIARTVLE